jgi:hypothetical protein
LQQQAFERVQAAERMARDGVGQARAQHHELVLALTLRRAYRPADCIIETAKLALGPAIHVPHARDHGMGLIVQVKTVGDELFELDVGRAFEGTASAGTASTFTTVAVTAGTIAAIAIMRRPVATGPVSSLSFATRAIPTLARWTSILAVAAWRPVFAFRLRSRLLGFLLCWLWLGRRGRLGRHLRGRSLI